ncbi:hypothetical protein ACFL1S_01090 [Pseudomonadota bacterium]
MRITVGGPARFLYGASFVDRQIDWEVEYGVGQHNQRRVCKDNNDLVNSEKIALVGDSFVYGQGIPDCMDLGSLIKGKRPFVKIENLGLIGIGLREYRIIIRDIVDRSYNRVYLLLYGNDIFGYPTDISVTGRLADRFSVFALLRKIKRAHVVGNYLPEIDAPDPIKVEDSGSKRFSNIEYILIQDPDYFFKSVNPPEDKLRKFNQALRVALGELAQFVDPQHIYVAMVPEGASVSKTLREYIEDNGGGVPEFGKPGLAYESIRSESKKMGVKFLETFVPFLECGGECYFPHDLHWNPEGSKLMAEIILDDWAQ